MGRRNVADGLAAQLRQASGFDAPSSGTVTVGDHRVLNMGVDRAAVILNDRAEQQRMVMGGRNEMQWFFDVQVFIRHNNDVVQARVDSDVYAQNIIDRLNANATLGGSVFDSLVTAVRLEDENFALPRSRTQFLLETLTVRATEHLAW